MTVEGKLNKLAANISYGRNIAGVHWRTDGGAGLRFSEQVAVQLMNDLIQTLPEPLDPIKFRGFSGNPFPSEPEAHWAI